MPHYNHLVRPLQQAVPSVLAEVLAAAPLSPGKVAFAWRAVVGPAMGRATAVRLDSGVLVVEPSSLQWARELARSREVLLARLQRLLGPDIVKSIVVRTEKHA